MANQRYRTFGIAALLAVTAVVAAMLVGYQNGFEVGESDGFVYGIDSKFVTATYYVGPLVITPDNQANTRADYTSLINLITSTAAGGTWKNPDASIEAYPLNHSLIVAQTARAHSEIEDLLKKLEEVSELHDRRIKNGSCVLCGHDIFTKPKTIVNDKSYRECGRCGHIAPWTAPASDNNKTQKTGDPAG